MQPPGEDGHRHRQRRRVLQDARLHRICARPPHRRRDGASRRTRRLNIMARDARDFPGFVRRKFARFRTAGPRGHGLHRADQLFRHASDAGRHRRFQGRDEGPQRARATCRRSRPAPSSTGCATSTTATPRNSCSRSPTRWHEEYKAITDAGFLLQIDDPDLPDGWQMFPDMTVKRLSQVRRRCASRRSITRCAASREEKVRLHICWGSNHGPHKNDIAVRGHHRHGAEGEGRAATRSSSPIRATSTNGGCGRT